MPLETASEIISSTAATSRRYAQLERQEQEDLDALLLEALDQEVRIVFSTSVCFIHR